MRLLIDGVDPRKIPAKAQVIAGYLDGRFAWRPDTWGLFAGRVVVRMCTQPWNDHGSALLVVYGCATVPDAPDWCVKARARGTVPTVCVHWDEWPNARAEFERRGIAQPLWWVRRWDGVSDLPTGAVAKQYRPAGAYDVGAAADHWPGVDAE